MESIQMVCGIHIWRGVVTYPGFCPFCMGNSRLSGKSRLTAFQTSRSLWEHILSHIDQLDFQINQPCPHPYCFSSSTFSNKSDLEHHLIDKHRLDHPSLPKGRKRKVEDFSGKQDDENASRRLKYQKTRNSSESTVTRADAQQAQCDSNLQTSDGDICRDCPPPIPTIKLSTVTREVTSLPISQSFGTEAVLTAITGDQQGDALAISPAQKPKSRRRAQQKTEAIDASKTIVLGDPVELERLEIVIQDSEDEVSSGILPPSNTRESGIEQVQMERSTQNDRRLSANFPIGLGNDPSRAMLMVENSDSDIQEPCLRQEARQPADSLSPNLKRDVPARLDRSILPHRRSPCAATQDGSVKMAVGEVSHLEDVLQHSVPAESLTHIEDALHNNLIIRIGADLAGSGMSNTQPVGIAHDSLRNVRSEEPRLGQPEASLKSAAKAQAWTLDLAKPTFVCNDSKSDAEFLEIDFLVDARNEGLQLDQPESYIESVAKAQHADFDSSFSVFDSNNLTTGSEVLEINYPRDLGKAEPLPGSAESPLGSAIKAQHPAFDFSQLVFDFEMSTTDAESLGIDPALLVDGSLPALYINPYEASPMLSDGGASTAKAESISTDPDHMLQTFHGGSPPPNEFVTMDTDYPFQFIDTMFEEIEPSAAEGMSWSFPVQNNPFSEWDLSNLSKSDTVVSEFDTLFPDI